MIDDEDRQDDEKLPLSFCKRRHLTFSAAGDLNFINQKWRMRERVSGVQNQNKSNFGIFSTKYHAVTD